MSIAENLSHIFQKKLGIDESDQDVLDPSRREFLKATVGAGLIYLSSHELIHRVGPVLELLSQRDFHNDPFVSSTSIYPRPTFQKNKVIAIGDSLILRKGKSPVWSAADRVRKHFGADWQVLMFAHEGENMRNILAQQREAMRYMKPGQDIDVVASGGGNDLLEKTLEDPRMRVRINKLLEDPISFDAFAIAQEIKDDIAQFTDNFYELLWNFKVLRSQGINIHRVILESVTNMGYIKMDDDTIKQSGIPLPDNNTELAHNIGANISSRLVGGMLDAAHRLGPNPGFDILLINNFDCKDLADIHLDDRGQQEAINQQFSRSYSDFAGGRMSLLQAM